MKQVIIKKGKLNLAASPVPKIDKGSVLIRVSFSTISLGTEISSVKSSGKSLWQKALDKPDKVKKVIKKLAEDGPIKTFSYVSGELNVSIASGYSVSGKVVEVGSNVRNIKPGDYVAAAGGSANHAEYVTVPEMLTVKLNTPDYLKESSSVAIGSIALQGVRRAKMQIGDRCMVLGVGAIGLLTVQLLVKSGVRVIAVDLDNRKLELAKQFGAEHAIIGNDNLISSVLAWTDDIGVDSVIFTAATNDSEPLNNCFKVCRKKGKVILVGVSGMLIDRKNIYQKEIDFCISTSYGPGRYDNDYEQNGQDYPIGYVRWTENRNMAEYIRLIENEALKLDDIITGVYDLEEVNSAFGNSQETLTLLNVLQYKWSKVDPAKRVFLEKRKKLGDAKINVGIIGVGSFAKNTTLPVLDELKKNYNIVAISNRSGYKASDIGQKYGVEFITSDPNEIISDKNIDLVIITTRHKNHGELVINALENGKNVFVEKPLAINEEEVDKIEQFYQRQDNEKPILLVGFNRRYAPIIQKLKQVTDTRINPLLIYYRMNAGHVPYDHWVFEEGGRIIGEGCHIIDLVTFLTSSRLESISTESLGKSEQNIYSDNKSFVLKYSDGSLAHITYYSVGSNELPKEYMEVHFDQKTIIMNDYKSIQSYGCTIKHKESKTSEKGHFEILQELGKYLQGDKNAQLIPIDELISTTKATILLDKS